MLIYQAIQLSGPVGYVLVACSIAALAIILAKTGQFVWIGTRRMAFVEEAIQRYEPDQPAALLAFLGQHEHPVAKVMVVITTHGGSAVDAEAVKAEVHRVGSQQVRLLEAWFRQLSLIAHLSPMLGLFGTVIGMIQAFMDIEHAGSSVGPAVLAGGIWEALLTTAMGLAVAIPAKAALAMLEGEVDHVRNAMSDAALRMFHQRFGLAGGAPSLAARDGHTSSDAATQAPGRAANAQVHAEQPTPSIGGLAR